jgi:hypothetical protein
MRAGFQALKRVVMSTVVIAAGVMPGVSAEDAVPTKLDASEARDFINNWAVTIDMMGRPMNFNMNVVNLEGKVGATIDSPQLPEPSAIDDISIDERGHMVLKYPMKFGQQEFRITVTAEASAEGIEGTFAEDSGLFSAPFTAVPAGGDDAEIRETRSRNRRMAANSARLRFGEEKVNINFHPLTTTTEDYKRLQEIKEGEVFEFVGGRATKLMTDVDMKFAQAVVKKENVAPDYPGVYSVWMRKTADGWTLIFNSEADVWGTMHNPETDAAEVALEAGKPAEPAETFKVELEQTENGGIVRIVWGDMQWAAPFEVEGFVGKTAAPAESAPAAPTGNAD